MVLSDKDILTLIDSKELIIDPFDKNDLQESSINLHLQESIVKYKDNNLVDLKNDKFIQHYDFKLYDSGYKVMPNEFFVGLSVEKITMPNGYMGLIETRRSAADAGIQAHLGDGHIDPGFVGHISLQIKNNSNQIVIIYPGLYIAKLYILKMTSLALHPYSKA